jgi:hypothetical protein
LKRKNFFHLIHGLVAYQYILVYDGAYRYSVEIASLTWHHKACLNHIKNMPLQKTWREAVMQHLSQAEFDAAWERGKTLEFYTVVEQILKELESG